MADDASANKMSITVFPRQRLNTIDRKIYSGFVEHMGRCVMGGLYDPENPNKSLLTPENFRRDVMDILRPLEIPVFRYPGGNFCATYHWLDGVGPRETRPSRPELAWGAVETNHFGTDEFLEWCRQMNTEAYLCLNFGTGTLDEAMSWVEYCNGTNNTYYANLRRRHGHAEPYKVKYWALGNEMWGPWQMCQMTAEAYADKAFQWAKALKLLDPSIELVLCGKEGATSWDYTVLKHCLQPAGLSDLGEERGPLIDMHSIHLYTASEDSHYANAFAPLAAERSIEICSGLIDLATIENKLPPGQKRPSICFDEWNVWSPHRAPGSKGAEEKYTLSDCLAVAVWLNVLVRQSKHLGMACIAQSVNVISPLMTTPSGTIKQTTWYPYELFCRFMRGHQITVHLSTTDDSDEDQYTGPTKPEWIRDVVFNKPQNTHWLDISASFDPIVVGSETGAGAGAGAGHVNVAVVNIHQDRDIEVDFNIFDAININNNNKEQVQVFTVTGENVHVTNMDGHEEVGIKESIWQRQCRGDKFTFPKHSFTLLRWKVYRANNGS